MSIRKKTILYLLLYVSFAVACVAICPFVGGESIDYRNIFSEIVNGKESIDTEIFLQLRLPRIILAFLAGGCLAIVGGTFQVILRNPLATPYTLGVTGGSAVGAYIAIAFPALSFSYGPFSSVQLFSLITAAVAMLAIYLIARKTTSISMMTLLLAGVTISILCSSILMLIRYIASPDLLVEMDRWLMGSLDIAGYRDLAATMPLVFIGLGLLLMNVNSINHLSLGHEMAMGHGIDVKALQKSCLIGGSIATVSIISLAGPIAFMGLIVPHSVRRLSGNDHRMVTTGSFFVGGGFLVLCDTLARTVISPAEIPVGIITAIIGGPFFIYILIKAR